MHGGIPKLQLNFNYLLRINAYRLNKDFKNLLEELTWNDPNHGYNDDPDYKFNGTRNTGNEFTDKVVVPFCKKHNVQLIVRGHEAQPYGFHIFKRKQPLFTLFSAPDYEGSGSIGAILKVIRRPDGTIELILVQFDPLLPKKPMSTEKTVAVAVVGAAAVAGIVAGVSYAKGKLQMDPSQAVRESFAEKSMILSRVVNAVSISASTGTGPFDENQLINELFPYGNNTDLRALRGMKSLEWSNDYDGISELIGSECTGDNGCGVHKKMLDEIEKVVDLKVDPQDLKKIVKPASNEDGAAIKASLDTLIAEKKADAILEAIAITTAPASEIDDKNWYISIGRAVRLENSKEYVKQLQNLSSLLNIKDHFDAYVKMLEVISPLISVQQFKIDLDAAQEKYQKLMSVATPDFIKNLNSKVSKLAEMDPTMNENKLITAGFYNGFEDMKNVLKDDENAWLKEVLNLGKDLKELKAKLTSLEGLVEKLEPLNKVWKEVNFDVAQKSIYDMQLFVSNLDAFSGISNTLSSVQTCLKDVKTDQKFKVDSAGWIKTLQLSSTHLTSLKSSIDAFASDEAAKQLTNLSNLVNGSNLERDKLKTDVQKLVGLLPVNENLKKLQNALNSVDVKEVEKSFSIIKQIDSTVIIPFNTWIGNLDFSAISTCLKGQNVKEDLEKMNPKLQVLIGNKPVGNQLEPVRKKESDPKVKKMLEKLWNENTVKMLEGILDAADKLDEEINKKKEIKMIKDFSDPYNAASEAPVSKVDIKKLAMVLDGKIQDPKLTASMNKLKSLDLKFSKHENVVQNTVDIHKYFRSLFGIDDDCIEGSCEKSSDNTAYIIGGVVLGCAVLGGIASFFLYKRFKKVPEKSKSDSSVVTPTPSTETGGSKDEEKKKDGEEDPKNNQITKKDRKKEDEDLSKKLKELEEHSKKKTNKKTVPVDRLEENKMKVYPIGNGVSVVVDKDKKFSVVPDTSCNRDCAADSGRTKTMKELRKKEKEVTENKDHVEDEKKIKVPEHLKNFEEDIKKKAAQVKEDEMYNLKICVPKETGGKIKVAPWTRAVHSRRRPPPPIVHSNRPAFSQEALMRGDYIPYVIRHPIGKGNENVIDPRADPDHTDPTQSTLDESTRQLRTASSTTNDLVTAASNTATAVQQLTPAQIALNEMEDFMKKKNH
ncbi:hypothetical protein CAEBREN_20470 [Caenorhabditis brenneri]|uniref:Serine/threonine specific protein phosphatases domain-containing protein n=1 Tax=Caenorhabditis brenneri TaxID=135651 RepID=G0PCY4_CAEBE|nr:hypothetical protein CAEBREN_20470 [Caenorhabditis brenneri]